MRPPPEHVPARWRMLWIPLAAAIAVMPLIHHGCSCGHDIDFHLLSWMEAAQQFSHGSLHPHWAFTPAFNAGEPRFVFYPPISWTLGALLGLALTHLPRVTEADGWNAVPILFTWIALTLSGLTMHRLARAFTGANAALLASIVYLANPYMLFTAYERTAYAELLAAAWVPLLFLAILRRRVTPTRIAIPLALLWLTNIPAAVMESYTLAALAALRVLSTFRANGSPGASTIASETWVARHRISLSLALNTTSGTILGLALAAFYLIPAAFQRRFIQFAMATTSGMRIDQSFLFEHTGASRDALMHDQVLRTASVIAIILLAVTAVALAITALGTRRNTAVAKDSQSATASSLPFPTLPLAILTAGIAFLLTPPSLFLWNHIPEASLLQFTWRLLAILAPVAALSLAAVASRIPLNQLQTAALNLFAAIVFSHVAYHAFVQPCDPEDTPTARLALFHSNAGTDPTDEYTPATADNDALAPGDPPYWLATSPDAPPPAASQPGPPPMHFNLNAPSAEDLILNLRDYPAWRVRIDGSSNAVRTPRPDGLIAVVVPAGFSTVDIDYSTSLDRTIGDDLTLFTLGLLILNHYRKRAAIVP